MKQKARRWGKATWGLFKATHRELIWGITGERKVAILARAATGALAKWMAGMVSQAAVLRARGILIAPGKIPMGLPDTPGRTEKINSDREKGM